MKFVFRWLKNKISEIEKENYLSTTRSELVSTDTKESNLQTNGTQFTVYKADGGFVVETFYRDKHHDRHTEMYVITQDQNFGEKISQILTYETLKR